MKKTFYFCIIILIIGTIIGTMFNDNNLENKQVFNETKKYYLLKENNINIGLTSTKELASKIINTLNEKNIIIEEIILTNKTLEESVIQYDILLKNANNIEEVKAIEKVVLSEYENINYRE